MTTKIKSDGGSSSYYHIDLPKHVLQLRFDDRNNVIGYRIEVKDVIKYALGNDFDKGNIFKGLVREDAKEGCDKLYNLNKCKFFIEEMIKDESV